MSHNYGLISQVDAVVLEKTLDLVIADFPNQPICVLELGVYSGRTLNGIKKYIEAKGRDCILTGIDNQRDGQERIDWPEGATLIEADTSAASFKIKGHSQHVVIVDALHTFSGVISDYYCYKGKVKYDGFMMFHDSGAHILPRTDWQRIGDKADDNQYISVRKALKEIGLIGKPNLEWELIFDEADINDPCGGYSVFKRML